MPLAGSVSVSCTEIIHLCEGLLVASLADLQTALEDAGAVFRASVLL